MLRSFSLITLLVIPLALVTSPVSGQVIQPGWLTLPQHSVATTEDALALLVNPAGLGIKTGSSFYLLMPYREKGNFGDFGAVVGGEGLSFAAEIMSDSLPWLSGTLPESRRRYTWGMGFGDHGNYFGFAYSWTTRIDRQNTWDLGYMGRPFRFLSYGLVARGINEPKLGGIKTPIAYNAGVAVRPLALFGIAQGKGDRLTLSLDANMRRIDGNSAAGIEKEGYTDNIDFNIGAALQVVPGVTAHVDYSPELKGLLAHDARISGGLSLNFGSGSIGGYQSETQNNRLTGTTYLSGYELYRPSILQKPQKKFVVVNLNGPIVEQNRGGFIFSPRFRTIYKFNKQMKKLSEDPEVEGILLKIGGFSAGWAKMQEIRETLMKFKASGKKIIVYMEEGGNGAYYLATVADKIYLPPGGYLNVSGLAAQALFVKGTLAKIGVEPQMEHIGDYKSASDMFMRENMSDAQREATDAILDDFFDEFVNAIAAGRGKSADDIRTIIDNGPFTSEDALKHGMIDSLVYEDQLDDLIKSISSKKVKQVSEKKYAMKRNYPVEWCDVRAKKIAIVYGTGGITSGESSSGGLFGGETMGSNTIARALKQAREDKEVAAVVFRVDSPGGSALASELILREVSRYKEGDNKKPIIVSMSDVAGSGGYYIACLADTIIAMPGTITGSIGVISGKFAVDGLYKKIALNQETLKRGKFADMYWASRPFNDEEWEKLRDHINQIYQLFVKRVADGRNMDTSAVNKIAQGRIWSGTDAKENGLVDLNGGLALALDVAAQMGGIKSGETFDVKSYPQSKHDFNFGSEWMNARIRQALPVSLVQVADKLADEQRWNNGEVLMLMPFDLEVK